jgi:hypothetical protein
MDGTDRRFDPLFRDVDHFYYKALLSMRKVLLIIAFTILLAMNSGAGATGADLPGGKAGLLDGKVFIGHVGPKGADANGEDELVFQNGKFLSTGCIRYGFAAAPYSASRQHDRILFEVETLSSRHGRIVWRGHVQGNQAEAVYVWTKDRWYWFDAHEENWFKGRLKTE